MKECSERSLWRERWCWGEIDRDRDGEMRMRERERERERSENLPWKLGNYWIFSSNPSSLEGLSVLKFM